MHGPAGSDTLGCPGAAVGSAGSFCSPGGLPQGLRTQPCPARGNSGRLGIAAGLQNPPGKRRAALSRAAVRAERAPLGMGMEGEWEWEWKGRRKEWNGNREEN